MTMANPFPDHLHSSWCLLVSSCLLASAAISCALLRSQIRTRLSPESLPVLALLDFLCGLELCVCGFELGVVLDIYGGSYFMIGDNNENMIIQAFLSTLLFCGWLSFGRYWSSITIIIII